MTDTKTTVTEAQLIDMEQVGKGRNDVDPVIYRLYYDRETNQHYTAHQYGVMTDKGPQYDTTIVPVKSTPTIGVNVSDAYNRLKSFGIHVEYDDVEKMANYHKEYVQETFAYHMYDEYRLVVHGNDVGLMLDDPYCGYLKNAPIDIDDIENHEVFRAFSPSKDFAPHCEFYGKLHPLTN